MSIPVVNHSLKYNPGLDGLRGIAISLVLLFHIWPEYFSFGYVGVDIFFVLSGYLITKIIDIKLKSNSFSFKEFYRNRIRRIFPSMIIVVLTTFFIGYMFLFPSELEQLGKHINSSVFFYQNFRLIGEVGYWDEAAQLKPLLHFWSLSIEEQFYLLWPFIILFIYKLRLNLFIYLLFIFFLFIIIPKFTSIDVFYHSFSRFWELSFGGLIYASSTRFNILNYISKLHVVIYILFMVSIGLAYGNIKFDLIKTLFVVVFTGLLILSISVNKNNKILSSSALVFLGVISFPLYLWHYVFISYMHIFGLEVENYGILIILFSIFISYLTYRYIEIYARKQNSYKFAFLLFAVALAVGFLGYYINKENGLPNRNHLASDDNFNQQFIKPIKKDDNGLVLSKDILGHNADQDFIRSTSPVKSTKHILIIGDSHAYASYEGFAEELKKHGYDSFLVASNSCPPYIDSNKAIGTTFNSAKKCKSHIEETYDILDKSDFSKVIFIVRGPKYILKKGFGLVDNEHSIKNLKLFSDYNKTICNTSHEKLFYQNIEKTFKYFNNLNIELYFILENPELGFSPRNCISRPFNIFPKESCKVQYKKYLERMSEYNNLVINIAKKYSNISILDPTSVFCDNEYCYGIKNGMMLYSDDDHLSVDGSKMQARYFIEQILSSRTSSDK